MALKKEYAWVLYLSIMLAMAGFIVYDAINNKTFTRTIKTKSVALVRVSNVVYHCEELKLSNCGYSAKCGAEKFNCLSDLEFQLIK